MQRNIENYHTLIIIIISSFRMLGLTATADPQLLDCNSGTDSEYHGHVYPTQTRMRLRLREALKPVYFT